MKRYRTKLASSLSPTAWLFSGWNWQANKLRCRTAATTGPPWSQVSAMDAGSRGWAAYEWTK